jgi:biotin carboxylase
LQDAEVAVPEHRIISLDAALQPQLVSIKYPVVIKPVSLSASRGVIRVDDEHACLQAIERIKRILATEEQLPIDETNKLLVETFIPGHEIALEGLLRKGDLELLTMFDKPDPMQGPFFEETYYITPSSHSDEIQQAALQTVQAACRAYGLVEGPVHAELRISDEGIWIIEVASRTIGGECARMLTYGTGYDLETLVIKKALGEKVEVELQDEALGVLMLPIPGAGVLRRVEGLQAAQKVAGVEEILISVREGYELVPLPEGGSYLGFIFARASSPRLVEAALREAHSKMDIIVAPVFRMVDGSVGWVKPIITHDEN